MKDLEQLVQYLDGELNEYEKQQLIEKLKNDPSLREKLNIIKDIDLLLGDRHLESLEESLKEIEAQHKGEHALIPSISAPKKLLWLKAAALIIILVSAASYFVFHFSNTPKNPDDLFAAYYEKMPADFTTRSQDTQQDDFNSAIKLYNENDYSQAIVGLNKVIQKDQSNNAAQLFLGICYIETKQFEGAAAQFEKVIKKHDPLFEEHAEWYLALSYIKTNKPGLAKPLLSKLVNSKAFYAKQASDLLKKLE